MDLYEEYALAHRRDVQCLISSDRNVRKQALDRLAESLNRDFFLQEAQSAVFRLFSDSIDRVREAAVLFVSKLYELDVNELKVIPQTLGTIFPLLSSRLKSEQSEEIKLALLQLLQLVLTTAVAHAAVKAAVSDYSGDVLECLRQAVTDTCPDVKKAGCVAVAAVSAVLTCARLRHNAAQTKAVVTALVHNFKHSHWRVRQASLGSLCVLLKTDGLLLDFQSEVLAVLSSLISDRHCQVRLELVHSLSQWLQGLFALATGVASMVDGQYVLVDSEKENKFIASLLFYLLVTVRDEEVSKVALENIGTVASVHTSGQEGETTAVAAYLSKYETMYSHVDYMAIWRDSAVVSLITKYKTILLQLVFSNTGDLRRKSLEILAPFSLDSLDSVVNLLISDPNEYNTLLLNASVYSEYTVSILSRSIVNSLAQGNFITTNQALTVLHRSLVAAKPHLTVDTISQTLTILELCVGDSIPRGQVNQAVSMIAEFLLAVSTSGEGRLHSILLRSENADNLPCEIFTEAFFVKEAASVSLAVLTLLLRRTSVGVFSGFLESLVLPRLLKSTDEEIVKAEVLEVLDLVMNKLLKAEALHNFVSRAINEILMPFIEWRPGQGQAKIRRGALVVLLTAVDLLPAMGAETTLLTHWNVIKSAMDDSWVPDNRFAAVIAVRKLMIKSSERASVMASEAEEGTLEIFRDMYPELLKRLDDSQDAVRVEAAKTVAVMFQLIQHVATELETSGVQAGGVLLSTSSVKYIVKALLVHLEDQNDQVWCAVEEAVKKAALVSRLSVLDEVKAGEVKSAKPQRCAAILKLI